LAEASEREEKPMSVPNIGPELPGPHDPEETPRGGNAALVYRDDLPTDDVSAASTRASAVSHRFGGVRYALSRPPAESDNPALPESEPAPPPGESGDSDASE
jgi:hypothetical protein